MSSTGFTKIASIEMLEAIGEKLWKPFFAACDRLLAPDGLACIQAILVPDERSRYRASPTGSSATSSPAASFSRAAIRRALEPTRLGVVADTEIGGDYGETLALWRKRFRARLRRGARALGYDERFVRTWDFYLASCEALFRTGLMKDAQLVLAR